MAKTSLLRRLFGAIWTGITWIRLALSNILFLLMIAVIYFVYVGGAPEPLPDRAALLLNPAGKVVDQKSQLQPLEALLGGPSPASHEVLLRDVIDAIEYAREDPAITALVMELDQLLSVGISKSQEIIPALDAFRTSGKPIIAVGDFFTQDQYFLASQADTVVVHHMGAVALEGYASYHNYFSDALDKLSVNVHVFRAGEHKSVAEPFLRNDMSPGEKEITRNWLGDLWGQFTGTVEARRNLPPGAVDAYINDYAERLATQEGDGARTALEAGLVDKVLSRSQANEYLAGVVGATDDEGRYEAVPFEHYAARKRPSSLMGVEGDRVAVITARGDIMPGEQPPGTIGGDSLARLIKKTAGKTGVKAIVLRVTSGGGSVFASEVIRQQVLAARAAGIPVVVSMGAVAASGGYYISAEADEIWATPSTVTGSIGVFAAVPTFEQLLGRAGVNTDGVGTTELAGALRVDRPLNPELADALTRSVEFIYREFLQLVAAGRDMTVEEVSALAEGRVWSAQDALENGLIDKLGTLDDAVAAAAALAGLSDYEVDFVALPRSPREMLLQQLMNGARAAGLQDVAGVPATLPALLRPLGSAVAELAVLQDPRHLYLRCIPCGALH
jgi:protease-4